MFLVQPMACIGHFSKQFQVDANEKETHHRGKWRENRNSKMRSTDCGPPGLTFVHLHAKRMTRVVRCEVDDEQYKKGDEE